MTLLSYKQAAERLGLSVRSLQRLVDSGRVPAHRIGPRGGRIVWRDGVDYDVEMREVEDMTTANRHAPRRRDGRTRERQPLAELIPPGVDALLSTRQVCAALSIGPTKFRQMRRNEEFPPPDVRIGQDPRWRISTFNAWRKEA